MASLNLYQKDVMVAAGFWSVAAYSILFLFIEHCILKSFCDAAYHSEPISVPVSGRNDNHVTYIPTDLFLTNCSRICLKSFNI